MNPEERTPPEARPSWHAESVDLELADTRESDLEQVLELEADPDVAPWIAPWSRERHTRAIRERDEAHLRFVDAGGFAGFCLLAGLNDPSGSIELRRLALCRRGEGLGRHALALVLAHIFVKAGARRVWLDVVPANARAIRLYERAGFDSDGLTAATHLLPDGSFSPLRLMSISAPESH